MRAELFAIWGSAINPLFIKRCVGSLRNRWVESFMNRPGLTVGELTRDGPDGQKDGAET